MNIFFCLRFHVIKETAFYSLGHTGDFKSNFSLKTWFNHISFNKLTSTLSSIRPIWIVLWSYRSIMEITLKSYKTKSNASKIYGKFKYHYSNTNIEVVFDSYNNYINGGNMRKLHSWPANIGGQMVQPPRVLSSR